MMGLMGVRGVCSGVRGYGGHGGFGGAARRGAVLQCVFDLLCFFEIGCVFWVRCGGYGTGYGGTVRGTLQGYGGTLRYDNEEYAGTVVQCMMYVHRTTAPPAPYHRTPAPPPYPCTAPVPTPMLYLRVSLSQNSHKPWLLNLDRFKLSLHGSLIVALTSKRNVASIPGAADAAVICGFCGQALVQKVR